MAVASGVSKQHTCMRISTLTNTIDNVSIISEDVHVSLYSFLRVGRLHAVKAYGKIQAQLNNSVCYTSLFLYTSYTSLTLKLLVSSI
jgi:hypothetical protein